jgi:catalase-peroxidase
MAMNDEETLALIAGGHTFGKAHGAHKPDECLGADPAAAGVEQQGLGWKNTCGKGNAEDTITSGLEGAWSAAPTRFTQQYIDNLLNFTWVRTKSRPARSSGPHRSGCRADGARCPPVRCFSRADDVHHRHRAQGRPGVPQDSGQLAEEPRLVCQGLCAGVVQADAPRHGPQARYLGKDMPTESSPGRTRCPSRLMP